MTPDSSNVGLLHFLSLLLHLELLPTDTGFLLANGSALNKFPTVSSIRQINKWIDASRHSTIDDYPIPRHPFDELVRSDSLFYLFHLHYGLGHLLLRQSLPVLSTF